MDLFTQLEFNGLDERKWTRLVTKINTKMIQSRILGRHNDVQYQLGNYLVRAILIDADAVLQSD